MKTEIIHIGKMLTELVVQAQHIDSEDRDRNAYTGPKNEPE